MLTVGTHVRVLSDEYFSTFEPVGAIGVVVEVKEAGYRLRLKRPKYLPEGEYWPTNLRLFFRPEEIERV